MRNGMRSESGSSSLNFKGTNGKMPTEVVDKGIPAKDKVKGLECKGCGCKHFRAICAPHLRWQDHTSARASELRQNYDYMGKGEL